MNEEDKGWAPHIERAHHVVASANAADHLAAMQIVEQSCVALRDLLGEHRLHPDPERAIYLKSLLKSLESIQQGVELEDALHCERRSGSALIRR